MSDMQQAAVEHLLLKLKQMGDEADGIASGQEAAAEGTSNYKRRLGHEESAEFHRALAEVVQQAIVAVQNNVPGAMPGFPGAAGAVWRDADGDSWTLCDDGRFRLWGGGNGVEPAEVARKYGPMTVAGGA